MNMNMLFNMFTRLVARRAMNWGINKGMGKIARGKGKGPAGGQPGLGQTGRRGPGGSADLAKKMRTLSRLTRR